MSKAQLKEDKQCWEDCKKVVLNLNQSKAEAVSRDVEPQQQLADISPVAHGCLISLAGNSGMGQVGKGHQSRSWELPLCFVLSLSHWRELTANCTGERKKATSNTRWCKFHCTLGFKNNLGDLYFRTEQSFEMYQYLLPKYPFCWMFLERVFLLIYIRRYSIEFT